MSDSASLLPLFLRVRGRRVVVVGAGEIGTRKAFELVGCGADVSVVAPAASAELRRRADEGCLAWHERRFSPDDLGDAWLVFSATGDPSVQADVARAAEARRAFHVALDDPPNSSAFSAGIVRRGPFTVAISTGGAAPALVRLVREIIESALPEGDWVDAALALRARWRTAKTPMSARFGELLEAYVERSRRPH